MKKLILSIVLMLSLTVLSSCTDNDESMEMIENNTGNQQPGFDQFMIEKDDIEEPNDRDD